MLCRFDKLLSDEMPTMKQITNKEYEVVLVVYAGLRSADPGDHDPYGTDDVEALPQKDQRSPGLSHDALHEK